MGGPTELTGVTSGTVGSSLTITGTGFASNSQIAISSTSGTSTITWLVAGSSYCQRVTIAYGGVGTGNSLYTGSGASACLTTTASGLFKVTVKVPSLPGGAETIVVSDGTNTVSTPFTITPKISIKTTTGNNFGFPGESVTEQISATGFAAGEAVTFSTTAFTAGTFTGTAASCATTGTTVGSTSATAGAGSCQTSATSLLIADNTGGAKTITATGGTSGLTATTTFTVKPWAAFYNTASGATTFSFIGTAPTSANS